MGFEHLTSGWNRKKWGMGGWEGSPRDVLHVGCTMAIWMCLEIGYTPTMAWEWWFNQGINKKNIFSEKNNICLEIRNGKSSTNSWGSHCDHTPNPSANIDEGHGNSGRIMRHEGLGNMWQWHKWHPLGTWNPHRSWSLIKTDRMLNVSDLQEALIEHRGTYLFEIVWGPAGAFPL